MRYSGSISSHQVNSAGLWQRWILEPLGLDRQTASSLWVVVTGMGLMSSILIMTGGNIIIATASLIPFFVILLTVYRIDYSFLLLIGCVLIFDQYHIPGFTPITYEADYFRNLKEISYLPAFPAGVLNPIEIHLVLIAVVWFFTLAIKKNIKLLPVTIWPSLLMFFLWFAFAFVNGMKSGGQFLIALWEVRALFYLSFMVVMVPQIIQTKKQIIIFIWVCIITITVKAFQSIGRFVSLGFSTGGHETLSNHEDPVFSTTLFILLTTMAFTKATGKQKKMLLLLLVPLLFATYISLRRAAYAGMFVSFAALFLLLSWPERKQYLRVVFPGIVVLLLYGAMFWNSNSKLAAPVQLVKSGMVKPDLHTNPQDYYSNLYRDYEDYNLAQTVVKSPVIGIGFGNKYEMPLNLANIKFPLRDYIPHNEIFWLLVKTGSIGFFFFWLYFNAFVYRGTVLFNQIQDPYLKAVCAMIVIAVINQMVVSYFDLQLTYYRNMIYLGALMGLLPAIEHIESKGKENE